MTNSLIINRNILSTMKLPIILVIIVLFTLFLGKYIPYDIKRVFLAISISIKEVLLYILPVIIFSYIFSSIFTLQHKAFKFIVLALTTIVISNYISVIISYFCGVFVTENINFTKIILLKKQHLLQPLWDWHLEQLISNKIALASGLAFGWYCTYIHSHEAETRAEELRLIVTTFLKRVLIPLLPFLIFGFFLKLEHEGVLPKLLKSYGLLILYVIIIQILAILAIFMIAARFKLQAVSKCIIEGFSSAIAGFSTMSSVTVMSMTIEAAEKHAKNAERVRAFIPTASNIHLIGDNIAICIISIAILKTYNMKIPGFIDFLIFALYYVMAKFAVAGIPTGTIIVMLPILRENLHFNNEMLSLITAIYITLEPIFTAVNIYCNIGLSLILSGYSKKRVIAKQTQIEYLTFKQLREELDKKNKLLRERQELTDKTKDTTIKAELVEKKLINSPTKGVTRSKKSRAKAKQVKQKLQPNQPDIANARSTKKKGNTTVKINTPAISQLKHKSKIKKITK